MKVLCVALLFFCQAGFALTFSNPTKLTVEIDYINNGLFFSTPYHMTVYPGQIGIMSTDNLAPKAIVAVNIEAKDPVSGRFISWYFARTWSDNTYDLRYSKVLDRPELAVNGSYHF